MKYKIVWLLFAFSNYLNIFVIGEKNFDSCAYDSEPGAIVHVMECGNLEENSNHADELNARTGISCVDGSRSWYAGKDESRLSESGRINQLSFQKCQMPTLPRKFFEFLRTIYTIQMSNCSIEAIDGEIFPEDSVLEKLFAAHNNIRKLPDFLFANTIHIKTIDFSYNQIEKIDPNAFQNVETSLQWINLANNRIGVFETSANFASMIGLNLSHNLLETFQLDLNACESMELLNLANNRIKTLGCNSFFNSMSNGVSVNVSMNQLREVDLNCDINCGTWILDISDNSVENLNLSSSLVKSIESLIASKNNIKGLSIGIDLNELKELKLANNNLTSISLINCSSLNTLDLSFNGIQRLRVDSFGRMPELQHLHLDNNNLSKIDYGTFTHTTNLQTLNISHNNLSKFNFELFFPDFRSLTGIYLNDNKLKELTGWSATFFPALNELSISDNEFNCSYLVQFLGRNSEILPLISKSRTSTNITHKSNVYGVVCAEDTIGVDDQETVPTEVIPFNHKDDFKEHMTKLINTLAEDNSKSDFKEHLTNLTHKLSEHVANALNEQNTNLLNKIKEDKEEFSNQITSLVNKTSQSNTQAVQSHIIVQTTVRDFLIMFTCVACIAFISIKLFKSYKINQHLRSNQNEKSVVYLYSQQDAIVEASDI